MIYSLVGLMGAGKTTFGTELSKYLNYEFIDMDDFIEKNQKLTINSIFEKYGEQYFRKLEKYFLKEILMDNKDNNLVLATGGGVILDIENREILKKYTKVVFLNTDINLIKLRLVKEKDKRPLLNAIDWTEKLDSIMKDRQNLYLSTANIVLDIYNNNCKQYFEFVV